MAKKNKGARDARSGRYQEKLKTKATFGQLIRISVRDNKAKDSVAESDKPDEENNEDQECSTKK